MAYNLNCSISFCSMFKMMFDDQHWHVLLSAHFPFLFWMPTQTNLIRPENLKIKFMSTLHWKYPIYYIFDIWWALENHPLPISLPNSNFIDFILGDFRAQTEQINYCIGSTKCKTRWQRHLVVYECYYRLIQVSSKAFIKYKWKKIIIEYHSNDLLKFSWIDQ